MKSKAIKLILFDIDKTLLTSNGATLKAMTNAAKATFGSGFNFDNIERTGRLDPHILKEAMTNHQITWTPKLEQEFKQAYLHDLSCLTESITLLPGVNELLTQLNQFSGIQYGLTTGNYEQAAWIKMEAVGLPLDQFKYNGFGDQAQSRADLIRLAMTHCRNQSLSDLMPKEVMVLGDTPRDIAGAQEMGCLAVGVTTGHYDAEAMAKASPDLILKDLSNADPILELIESTQSMELA